MSADQPPPGIDLYADQRGRIIGSCAAVISLAVIFVFLRLLSRKLSRAGYWVRDSMRFNYFRCQMPMLDADGS